MDEEDLTGEEQPEEVAQEEGEEGGEEGEAAGGGEEEEAAGGEEEGPGEEEEGPGEEAPEEQPEEVVAVDEVDVEAAVVVEDPGVTSPPPPPAVVVVEPPLAQETSKTNCFKHMKIFVWRIMRYLMWWSKRSKCVDQI